MKVEISEQMLKFLVVCFTLTVVTLAVSAVSVFGEWQRLSTVRQLGEANKILDEVLERPKVKQLRKSPRHN